MDVLWMRISRNPSDPGQTFGHVDRGKILVLLNREDYWQCAYVIPKGAAEGIRQRGLDSFREEITAFEPFLRDRVQELRDWKGVSLLTVKVDRRAFALVCAGLLCIGDAAHAMSPIGGVGINLAIQDAVATANILGPKLQRNILNEHDLRGVQRRRNFPTRATQRMQIFVQNKIIQRAYAWRWEASYAHNLAIEAAAGVAQAWTDSSADRWCRLPSGACQGTLIKIRHSMGRVGMPFHGIRTLPKPGNALSRHGSAKARTSYKKGFYKLRPQNASGVVVSWGRKMRCRTRQALADGISGDHP